MGKCVEKFFKKVLIFLKAETEDKLHGVKLAPMLSKQVSVYELFVKKYQSLKFSNEFLSSGG